MISSRRNGTGNTMRLRDGPAGNTSPVPVRRRLSEDLIDAGMTASTILRCGASAESRPRRPSDTTSCTFCSRRIASARSAMSVVAVSSRRHQDARATSKRDVSGADDHRAAGRPAHRRRGGSACPQSAPGAALAPSRQLCRHGNARAGADPHPESRAPRFARADRVEHRRRGRAASSAGWVISTGPARPRRRRWPWRLRGSR